MLQRLKLSNQQLIWQGIIFCTAAFITIEAFLHFSLGYSFTQWQLWMDALISLIFLSDIFNNIKLRKKLRERQLPSRSSALFVDITMVIDIIAAIPFVTILYFSGLSYLTTLLCVLKIIRVAKIFHIFSMAKNLTLRPIIKVQFTLICTIVSLNVIACGWILIYPNNGDDIYTYYSKSLYWAVTTLTTIGYGDITPSTNIGRLYTMVIMILGVGVYGLVIGNVSRLISMADRYKEQTKEKIQDLNQFMRHYNIPDELQYAAFSYYNHLFQKRLSDNDTKIISELPNALQSELQIFMNVKLIGVVPAFQLCSQECLKEIASSLEQIFFSPNQVIIGKGDIGHDMYIIAHGVIDIIGANKSVLATLHEGQFFGEASLLETTKRTSDVRAQTYCDVYKFSKDAFLDIIERHPELLTSIKKVMTRRASDRRKGKT